MNTIKEWLTIPQAALLVGRKKTAVYDWVKAGKLQARIGVDGVKLVASKDAMRVESTVKRGRPTGSASRNGDN
jgi:hypothetical protein